MTRILLQYLLPLLLPTIMYLAWWYLIGRMSKSPDGTPLLLKQGPWFWLILSGLLLMSGGLIATAFLGGADPSGSYIAPRWEDGRIIPGHVE